MYKITEECIACGSCAAECPVEAISEAPGGEIYVIDQDVCTECGTCVDTCPTEAIIQQ
jgi:NAD-dependent dihydropyrimidine dehydrogenase PreA subunit